MNNMFGTTNTIDKLTKKSQDAIGVFRRTVADLALINGEIAKEREVKQEGINRLLEERKALEAQENENQRMIEKIEDFLS